MNFDQQSILLANPDLFFLVGLHEIGHALGLKHPHDGGAAGYPTFAELGISAYDWAPYTVMSYDSTYNGVYPSTLMVFDIYVLQYLYGANTATGAGDSIYQITNDGVVRTIWDASGIDTFDASLVNSPVIMDIHQGGFTQIGATTLVGVAINAVIENAIGGSSADDLIGNDVANNLAGNGGNDIVSGNGGSDYLDGGLGVDQLFGGDGDDLIVGTLPTISPTCRAATASIRCWCCDGTMFG